MIIYLETSRFLRVFCQAVGFILLGVMLMGLCACNITSPQRAFSVEDLMVDSHELPENWAVLSISDQPIVHFGHDEAIEMIFYYVPDSRQLTRGGITISQHRSEQHAERAYARQERGGYDEHSRWITTSVFTPEGFEFASAIADQVRFSCYGRTSEGLFEDNTGCKYLARYDEFVVCFNITFERGGQTFVTAEEVGKLVTAIDQQMIKYLADNRNG